MSDLHLLDPTHADDPAFDPDGAQARRVRATAMRSAPAVARPRGRRLAMAGAAVAAAVAFAVTVGTSTAPPDARAALVRAATQTGAADSGRVVVTIRGTVAATGSAVDLRTQIRFQGDDLEVTTEPARTIRLIDGVGYERDGSDPAARFRRLGKVDPVTFQVAGQYDDDGLVTLVRGTRDLEVGDAGDVTTYLGTTTAGAVEDAAPTAHSRAQGGVWDRQVRLEVSVAGDGLIRSVVVRDEGITRTTTYLDLGEPQEIERP